MAYYERFDAGAAIYEASRPKLGDQFVKIMHLYHPASLHTLVDVGCGTGLSTEQLAAHAQEVIGIDANVRMLSIAKKKTNHVMRFMEGNSEALPLSSHCADGIIVSQAFHWMEPQATLQEFGRVLKADGALFVVDYDWQFMLRAKVELILEKMRRQLSIWLTREGLDTRPPYSKAGHLTSLKQSRVFRFVREIHFSQWALFEARSLWNCELSKSSVQMLLPQLSGQEKAILDSFYHQLAEVLPTSIEGCILYTCYIGLV